MPKTVTGIPESSPKPNFRKDIKSILLLFFLYILQGIPLGISISVPFLLQARKVPYTEQAKFTLAFYPFSLKVLYAPIVDAVYWKRLGRRKSWLIPLQYLIAIFLLVLTFRVEALFESMDIVSLTAMFFMLNFLAASQDVAVDGWALTMLSPENVGYASTCNAVGQTLGVVMGYSVFLALESASFANKFRSVPLEKGLVSLPQYLLFWAIIFAITTTLILIFKKEKKECAEVTEQHMDILASYKNLWKVLRLRNVQIFIVFLLTARIGTAATDAMTKFKLVENGVAKETIAFFSIPLIPLKLLLPILTARWTVGANPMKLWILTIPFSLCFGIIWPILIFFIGNLRSEETGEFPYSFYFFLFAIFALELIPSYTRFVTGMGFSAKVSDPAIGGTYMTLLNTITNVGGTWPVTLALWLVEYVKIPLRACAGALMAVPESNPANYSSSEFNDTTLEDLRFENETTMDAVNPGGSCISKIDGYYVESLFCVTVGFVWLLWGRPTILRLQRKPRSSWKVVT